MPICYEIDIDIIRQDDDEGDESTSLPRRIITPVPLTPAQIREEIDGFWRDFMSIMGEYGTGREYSYRRGEGFRIISVYAC